MYLTRGNQSSRLGVGKAILLMATVLAAVGVARGEEPIAASVRVGGFSYTIPEAERIALADETLAQYVRLREQNAGTFAGELRLAQWCDRNALPKQAKAHWVRLVRLNPQEKRALRALDARWYRGALMPNEKADEIAAIEEEGRKQSKRFERKARVWRRTVIDGDDAEREAVLSELRSLDTAAATVLIGQVLLIPTDDDRRTSQLQQIGIRMLGELPSSPSMLAWFAVNSEIAEVQAAALDQLRSRPLDESIPLLVARLQMPLEVTVRADRKGERVDFSFYREGPGQSDLQTTFTAYRW